MSAPWHLRPTQQQQRCRPTTTRRRARTPRKAATTTTKTMWGPSTRRTWTVYRRRILSIILLQIDGNISALTALMRAAEARIQGVNYMMMGHDDTTHSRRLPPLVEIVRGEIAPADLESEAEALGGGGAVDVYLGRYLGRHDGRPVAIEKVRLSAAQLRQADGNTEAYRTKREARILLMTGHPNIIRCMGGCLHGGEALLVLEHAELGLVRDILQRPAAQRPLRVYAERKLQWVAYIVSALLYIHVTDAIHRDVKPANFLVTRNGRVWLAGFGLARYEDSKTHHTAKPGETTLGTWAYMAHELLRVARNQLAPYSKASDVYALGISIMEIVMEACWLSTTATITEILSLICDSLEHPEVPPHRRFLGSLLSAVAVAEKCWRPGVLARPRMALALKQLDSSNDAGGQDAAEAKAVEAKEEASKNAALVERLVKWLLSTSTTFAHPTRGATRRP